MMAEAAEEPRPPLHPKLRAMMDKLARLPPMHSHPLQDLRASATALFAGRAPRVEIARVEHRMVPGPAGAIPVRIYHPKPDIELPLVVFFHGGSFVMCGLDSHDPMCRRLAAGSRSVVASVDYRLAPEHPFPAAPDDALAATRWLAANAREIGADAGRIAVAGDSAGGNLAAVTAIALREAGADPIQAQLLVYPLTDAPDPRSRSYVENGQGCGLDSETMQQLWPLYHPATTCTDPRAAPLRAPSLVGLPPAYVITAGYDVLRDEGDAYAARLAEAGVPTVLRRYPDMNHGFLFAAGAIERANEALAEACSWLASTLDSRREQ